MKFILFLLFASFISAAQDCSPVNYVTAKNSPFAKIPVQDQDGTGICYAYTSGQLIDYHLLKTKQTSERVMHPVWIALKSSKKILYSGNEIDAINAVRTNGSCNYEYVDAALNVHGMTARLEGSPLVAFLEFYARALKKEAPTGNVTADTVRIAFDTAVAQTAPFCDEDVLWDELLPQLKVLNETSVQLFSRLLGNSCKADSLERYRIPQPLTAGQFESNEQAKLSLQDQIQKGPFTFGYCAEAWDSTSSNGMTRPGSNPVANCGLHSSMAVGRKQIGPHCYMLVRNTWGTGWGDWNQNSKCLCRNNATGAWVDECNATDHNDGQHTVEACYIGMNQLSKNLYDLTTFNP